VSRCLVMQDGDRHDHDFVELAVTMRGRATHVSSAGETSIGRGFAVLLQPGTWHAYQAVQDLEVINFLFPVAMARAEWRALLDRRVRSVLRSTERIQMTTLSEATLDVLDRLERVDRRSSGTLGLVIWALDQFASNVSADVALHPAIERAVSELEDHPADAWTSTSLAKTVGLDRAYLSRLFKAQVGLGPMAFLAILRADRAASLLRSSELNCGEVGLAVGYSDANLFSRRFRARFGVSPTQYRSRWLLKSTGHDPESVGQLQALSDFTS